MCCGCSLYWETLTADARAMPGKFPCILWLCAKGKATALRSRDAVVSLNYHELIIQNNRPAYIDAIIYILYYRDCWLFKETVSQWLFWHYSDCVALITCNIKSRIKVWAMSDVSSQFCRIIDGRAMHEVMSTRCEWLKNSSCYVLLRCWGYYAGLCTSASALVVVSAFAHVNDRLQ